ncbi:hypothetical protein ACLN6N_06100 [Sphingomonas carotinifaciens]|uniref:hypothetical protein n=1 Tax=Sphingomonas carotinifaciens TaxID=1166323 RepID=UPI0039A3873D
MHKIRLPAVVPNEGARRLGQFVAHRGVEETAQLLRTPADYVERMVLGEMVPGMTIGAALHRLMGLKARHFNMKPAGWWFDAAPTALPGRAA